MSIFDCFGSLLDGAAPPVDPIPLADAERREAFHIPANWREVVLLAKIDTFWSGGPLICDGWDFGGDA